MTRLCQAICQRSQGLGVRPGHLCGHPPAPSSPTARTVMTTAVPDLSPVPSAGQDAPWVPLRPPAWSAPQCPCAATHPHGTGGCPSCQALRDKGHAQEPRGRRTRGRTRAHTSPTWSQAGVCGQGPWGAGMGSRKCATAGRAHEAHTPPKRQAQAAKAGAQGSPAASNRPSSSMAASPTASGHPQM